jgi:hypothetical protein
MLKIKTETASQIAKSKMADKNGDGIVYRCSDCNDNYVRMYGVGGNGLGSVCGTWELTPEQIRYIHDNPGVNHTFEAIRALRGKN